MKKILSVFLSLVMVFALCSVFLNVSADTPTIAGTLTTNKTEYARGEKVNLTATLTSNSGFNILIMRFSEFPSFLTRSETVNEDDEEVTRGFETNGEVANNLLAGKELVFDSNAVPAENAQGTSSDTIATGILFTGSYKIPEDTPAGTYTITMVISRIANSDEVEAEEVSFATVSFTVTEAVSDTLMGDIDDDGEITDADCIILERYLAGWNVTIKEDASDIDGDEDITDADAILLARHLAGWPDNGNYFAD